MHDPIELALPYPMPFVRNSFTIGFQRWIVGAYDKRVSWEEFRHARCQPRRLGVSDGRNLFAEDLA